MIPILFHFGPFNLMGHPFSLTIYSYGLMMALGFIAADMVVASECRRRGYNPDFATALILAAALAGLAGARLYDIIDNFPLYMANPASMIFSGSGFVWYGGLIGGITGVGLVSRRWGVPFMITADMAAPALAIGQALGRIGCHLSGDGDWGLPSKLPWAVAYPHAIVGWNGDTVLKLDAHNNLVSGFFPGVRVQPAPIYEAILYTGVFLFLWSRRRNAGADGRIFYMYLVLAGASRFIVEFIRVNPRVLMGLSEAQLIAIAMMIIGSAALLLGNRRATQPLEGRGHETGAAIRA
ncbi:MAG TPA: prolipoprotein diacylglyceryl transferase family protein [Candidatus Binataceae bacterium]|nr:prolipoprotein diacylglyceryl transferase family protein [Candidatus Binataceae bacterium]